MTTRLLIYNDALLLCGEGLIASLTEDREPRRLLDQVWNSGGVRACLEKGQWHFAMRTVQLDPDPAIATTFGYRLAFTKPTDWLQTSAVCSDEYFKVPLLNYADEPENWYADIEPIYVKFVSAHVGFGGNLSRWPESFAKYVAAYFAGEIINKLGGTRPAQVARIHGPPGRPDKGEVSMRLHAARSAAALGQPTQFAAQGSWTLSRSGWRSGFRDGGNRGRLIG